MYTTMAGVVALRNLRKALQEDAGAEFPDAVLPELLLLYDVCKCLDMSYGTLSDIVGHKGLRGIQQHLESTVRPMSPNPQTSPPVIELKPKYRILTRG